MAQVLAPIQTSSTITMSYPPSDAYQSQSAQSRASQMRSSMYNGGNPSGTGYRGTSAPIAPYAFSSTPSLRQDTIRSVSAPNAQGLQQPANQTRLGHPSHPSSSSDSTVSTSGSSNRSITGFPVSKDDNDTQQPIESMVTSISLSTSVPDLSLAVGDAPVKPSPGRYRRAAGRTDSSNMVPTTSSPRSPTTTSPPAVSPQNKAAIISTDIPAPVRPGHNRASSADNSQLSRAGGVDAASRYRRRSFNGLEEKNLASTMASLQVAPNDAQNTNTPALNTVRPSSRPTSSHSHERQGSAGSASSNASARSQSQSGVSAPRTYASVAGGVASSASENVKRHTPSPLSYPISPVEPLSPTKTPVTSPAIKQLHAVSDRDRGMKSRLRRAFSFGSAAELRRASAENNLSAERARLRKDKYQSEEDAEQAAIIAKQEAAGIGAGIYSGQGGIGSTDNLSIQSAASSASVMLRKMGQGMKKGTKSIKGLFRPKSVIGVPAADGPITRPSVGQVSMVTVEAERQKVNVNANPHEQIGGGTGYPRLERNSIDAGQTAELVDPFGDSLSRKSIVGGDRERAEILSSMKKGILKRTGTNSDSGSPVLKPVDISNQRSNSPGTPKADNSSLRNEDYFGKPPRIPNGSTRSLPTTPHGGLRNITFSPRIQFHDAWSPQDYDRRGDIATCNRLTPMLAQQIKEELNSFKMEMEVHELSKPHTHFF